MEKIAIIKLGALGDVVRTLPILLGIKEKFPKSEITWITNPNAEQIVQQSQHVSRVILTPCEIKEEFNLLYNFDIDEEATNLAQKISAKEKKGFYSNEGFLSAFNPSAEYYLNTIFDDELKKINTKTYQQMMFEVAELEYKKQHHNLLLNEKEKKYADDFLKKNKLQDKKIIGIHIGASARWPSKKWHSNKIIELIKILEKKNYKVILFGGKDEKKDLDEISLILKKDKITVAKQDPFCSVMEFSALVNLCELVICADSLAMHISLALKKPTIALFFVTSYSEVEDYGLLKKIVSPMHKDFFPEKSDQYSEELVKSISVEEVLRAITENNNS